MVELYCIQWRWILGEGGGGGYLFCFLPQCAEDCEMPGDRLSGSSPQCGPTGGTLRLQTLFLANSGDAREE